MPTPLHTTHVPVRWSDMDELGHVNNAVYFTYFEQARIEMLRALATDGHWPEAERSGPVLAGVTANFRRPVVYPATVVVRHFAESVGRTSFTLRCELAVEGDEAAVAAEATTTLVWVDRQTGRPAPLPDAVRRLVGVPAP